MTSTFWRCAIISLLLWALPAQWLAAATGLPCAGHASTAVLARAIDLAQLPAASRQVPISSIAHHHGTTPEHLPGSQAAAHAPDGVDLGMHSTLDGTLTHGHAKCLGAGSCCLMAAMLPNTLPDFVRPGAWTAFTLMAQRHQAPLLSGPDRPPQIRLA